MSLHNTFFFSNTLLQLITTLLFKYRTHHQLLLPTSAVSGSGAHPSVEVVSCPEYLRYQYYLYGRLLERYLEAKLGSSRRAREKVRSLEQLLAGIDQIKAIIEGLFMDADESQISLVLNEIYRVGR